MKHYIDQVWGTGGLPVPGAQITVTVANSTPGTGALATIYSDDGITSIPGSVVSTDTTGTFQFYAPDGKYDLTVNSSGFTKIVAAVVIQDFIEANSGDSTANFNAVNATSFTGPLTGSATVPDGNVTTPAVNFSNDTGTGMYRAGTNLLDFAIAGIRRMELTTGNVSVFSGSTQGTLTGGGGVLAGTPGVNDSSITRISAGLWGVGTGAVGSTGGQLQASKIGLGAAPTSILDITGGGNANDINLHTVLDANEGITYTNLQGTWNTVIRSVNGNFAIRNVTNSIDALLIAPSTGQLQGVDGAAANPTFSFSSNTNTGFYKSGTNQVTFSAGGTVGATFKSTGVQLGSDTQFFNMGSAGDTSISRTAAGVVGIGTGTTGSVAGTLQLSKITLAATGVLNIGSSGVATPDTGLSRNGVGITAFGNGTAADTTGQVQMARLWNIRIADGFAGADCGAKINAAMTDLGATAGIVKFTQACGTTWTTAVTVTAGHTLQCAQDGVYNLSAAITVNANAGIMGTRFAGRDGGNLGGCVFKMTNAVNLSPMINFTGANGFLTNMVVDGNKANQTTAGVGVKISATAPVVITGCSIQNHLSHGVWVNSTTSNGNQSCCGRITDSFIWQNGGSGIYSFGTADWFFKMNEIEANGLSATVNCTNVANSVCTRTAGTAWTSDGSLVNTTVSINNSHFVVLSNTTTTITLTSNTGTLTGANLKMGSGFELRDSPTWRIEHNDIGGNAMDGALIYGFTSGLGSNREFFVGNQFGNNYENDIEVLGFDTGGAAFTAIQHVIVGNEFIGHGATTITGASPVANTWSQIRYTDNKADTITGNIFNNGGSVSYRDAVTFQESAASRATPFSWVANTIGPTAFGTTDLNCTLANNCAALMLNGNSQGTQSTQTISNPKISRGIGNSGTGFMHVRAATTCSTTAALNSSCTSTVTWPGTWNDTNYTAICNVVNPPAGLMVTWLGAKTTTTIPVQIFNGPGSSTAVTAGTAIIECIGVHD